MSQGNKGIKMLVIITIVIVVLIIALIFLNNAKNSSIGKVYNKPLEIAGQPFIGEENAPVTVIEFGDFKCPSCKAWGEMIYPQLEKDFIATGKVKFMFVNVLFHGEESERGSLAAETVWKLFPEYYWAFHHALFAAQPASQKHDEPWLTTEKVMEIIQEINGIDEKQFAASFQNKELISEVEKDMQFVDEYNVQYTPSIVVGDTMVKDPFDYETIKTLIEKKLEGM